MSERACPKCGAMCEGEDLGDHPGWLDYWCECGHSWGADDSDRLADHADNLRKQQKEGLR